ncbi:DUF4238 domain-containing protein [Dactylosporangium sp. NPDC000521]|uniref:DUF4238 domain-containing protein n=1 Tax=Dactylosporangium sp. NPDC000521 TaxID=3363975 RepID=UPI0036B07965
MMNEEWPLPGDPNGSVGWRHHLVPRFYLEGWSSRQRQIVMVTKPDWERTPPTDITNAGTERDFYTAVDKDGDFSGHIDHALQYVEDEASDALRRLLNPVFGVFPPPPDDKHAVATFMAFQYVRGRKSRKSVELHADFLARFEFAGMDETAIRERLRRNGVEPTPDVVRESLEFVENLDEYTIVPDPNEHLRMMGSHAWEIYKVLLRRHWYLAKFADPLLLTCDEPVALYKANPSKFSGYGFLNADEVWLPLTPRHLLVLASERRLPEGSVIDADPSTAETVNRVLVHNAYKYVFLHPDYDVLPADLPSDGPLYQVHAPGLAFADRYNAPLGDRQTGRRRGVKRKNADRQAKQR